jgi:hypothetical protein
VISIYSNRVENAMKISPTRCPLVLLAWLFACAIGFSEDRADLASEPEFRHSVQPVRISLGTVPPAPAASADDGSSNVAHDHNDPGSQVVEPALINPFAERVEYDPRISEPTPGFHWRLSEALFAALESPVEPLGGFFASMIGAEHHHVQTELDSRPIGIQPIPPRPNLVFETGDHFLSTGFLEQGLEIPTGAVWRPSIWVWGEMRGGYNYFDRSAAPAVHEAATRLDLFAQLNLSGTERILVGLRPLDRERGAVRQFTSYDFQNDRGIDATNIDVQTLFFEGDFGEIFPGLDPYDTESLDYGFSIGRQPMLFQQGLLINEDMIDALTVTRNTLNGQGNLNLRMTGVYAWNRINRNNNVPDDNAQMVGLFTESDFRWATVNADVAYLASGTPALGDSLAFGLSAIRRFQGFDNIYNSSAHFLASIATSGETAASGDGILLFHQFSWTPHHTEDLIYLNAFWAIDQFTSPARGPLMGGPLGQVGILFAAPGLGQFGAPLSNQATNAAGASLGYQFFFDETRQQVIWEVGGRSDTDDTNQAAIATALQYQRAFGQHWIFLMNGFVAKREAQSVLPGGRLEVLYRF